MENHLRLAEARGSLVAPNSLVQDKALEMCILLSEQVRQKDRVDRVKVAMMASRVDIERVYAFFPEYFPDDFAESLAFSRAQGEDGEFDIDKIDDSKIDWRAEGVSEDEDDEITKWIQQREGGSLTLAEMEGGWR